MKKLKYAQKKLTADATTTWTDSDQGLIPTNGVSVYKCFEKYLHIFQNTTGRIVYLRPLTFSWTEYFPLPTDAWLGGRIPLFNRGVNRQLAKKYNMDMNKVKDMKDIEEIQDEYASVMKKSLRSSSIDEIRKYVKNYLKVDWLKCFYGNPPFGNLATQGQYVCWPIIKLALAMLDPKDGVAAIIIPSSLFNGASDILTSLRNEILPFIEYIDMDVNTYFKEAGNEPGINMSSLVINYAKTSNTVKVKLDGIVHEVSCLNNDLVYLLNPEMEIIDYVRSETKNHTKLEDIFISDFAQTAGGSDEIPVSRKKMLRLGYASKEFNAEKEHTQPFYYSCVKMYTTLENIKKHYNKTNGVLTMKMNYNGYHTMPGKEEYYMPIDTYPIGKCAEGIPVDSIDEGELVRKCYTRKLPVFISENNKGNNAYNGAMYFLPWIEKSKYEVVQDKDWYELANLSDKQIKVVEDWYEKWYEKHAPKQ